METSRWTLVVLLGSAVVGFALTRTTRPRAVRGALSSPAPAAGEVVSRLRLRELRFADDALTLGEGAGGSIGLWMKGKGGGSLQLGVHENGYPFVLVSDGNIRNFGLGRVDGVEASPILVFRSEDQVKLVFGLDMTHPAREPFFVRWSAQGEKLVSLGAYCDDPSRACTQ